MEDANASQGHIPAPAGSTASGGNGNDNDNDKKTTIIAIILIVLAVVIVVGISLTSLISAGVIDFGGEPETATEDESTEELSEYDKLDQKIGEKLNGTSKKDSNLENEITGYIDDLNSAEDTEYIDLVYARALLARYYLSTGQQSKGLNYLRNHLNDLGETVDTDDYDFDTARTNYTADEMEAFIIYNMVLFNYYMDLEEYSDAEMIAQRLYRTVPDDTTMHYDNWLGTKYIVENRIAEIDWDEVDDDDF